MAKLSCLLYTLFFAFYFNHSAYASAVYNVLSFGAKPDGVTDSTSAFLNVWSAACASADSSAINVPKGLYLLGSIVFKGDCKSSDITFWIDGTLVAAVDYRVLAQSSTWLSFEGVTGVSIFGGTLDAKGSSLWTCKAAATNCPTGASTLTFTNSNNIRISGLLSLDSQLFHVVFNGCNNVNVERVKIIAGGDSPNTDGIHVQFSQNVAILESTIKTGDDCISIGPGTQNLWIERVSCGPGHGISIGSLGKEMEEEGVQNVTVKEAVFVNSENGLRIKSWARPSSGFVQGVRFLGAVMKNVQNPILIDQNYCPHNINCPAQESGVKISDVIYKDIRGTSASQVAVKFDCSSKNPCTGIRLENVNLTCPNQAAQSFCTNVIGKILGLVQPNSCL